MGCHGASPHPRWDTYDIWPGAYGSEAESLIRTGGKEDKLFRAFLQSRANNPRYSLLKLASADEIDNYIVNHDHYVPAAYPQIGPLGAQGLTSKLSTLNFRRVISEMKAMPYFDKFKFAALAGLLNCDRIEAYSPVRSEESLKKIEQETIAGYKSYYANRLKRQNDSNSGANDSKFPTFNVSKNFYEPGRRMIPYASVIALPIAKLRYVMATQNKSTDDWFLPLEDYAYEWNDGDCGNQGVQLTAMLADELSTSDPDLMKALNLTIKQSAFDYGNDKVRCFEPAISPTRDEIEQASKQDRDRATNAMLKKPFVSAEACALLKKRSLEAFAN